MTAKEFLSQAEYIEQRIDSKLQQIQALRSLAEKTASILSPMPKSDRRNFHRTEDILVRMLDLETELDGDVSELMDVKREIAATIKCVKNSKHRTLLELRYLCDKSWDEVASEMFYSLRNVHILHSAALKEVETIIEKPAS